MLRLCLKLAYIFKSVGNVVFAQIKKIIRFLTKSFLTNHHIFADDLCVCVCVYVCVCVFVYVCI